MNGTKYVVILCDGMADKPDSDAGTPMSVAKKPNMDALAARSVFGTAKTVPDGMSPGSDNANLSVMGYNPEKCYSGRSPLEAVSMGLKLDDGDVTYRLNLVTLSENEPYENKTMLDYSAGEIATADAGQLIELLKPYAPKGTLLKSGVSYRHCMLRKNGETGAALTPPHDITGKMITEYLPREAYSDEILAFMKKSYEVLSSPENKTKANSAWLWGEGTKPKLENFTKLHGRTGAVISAVDLIKGIAISAGMTSIDVEGATGTVNTDFGAKAAAAVKALETHDFVYIHLEAPDECSHQGDRDGKIRSIELIDEKIVAPVRSYLKNSGTNYKILITPDHPTPLSIRTHSREPVPFILYDSKNETKGIDSYTEKNCERGIYLEKGYELLPLLFKN